MNKSVTACRLSPMVDMLGESPVWDDRLQRLYWVDGITRLVRFHEPAQGSFGSIELPQTIGCVALHHDPGKLVVALVDGIYALDLATQQLEPLFRPEPVNDRIRFNDGKVDRQGRFLCGTMGIYAEPLGRLYRVTRNGEAETIATGIRISNALCFSPDGGTFYFADSLDQSIRAYRYSAGPEPLTEPRLFVDTKAYRSGPDGATVDSDGCIWVALVKAGRIARFSADGKLLRMVEAPMDMPSSVAFGGPNFNTLYVTSIKDSGTGRAVSRHPNAGLLFAIDGLGATGLPEPKFGSGAEG